MNGFYLAVAREILCVEGQNTPHAIYMHGGNEPGVVDLNSGDAIVHQQPSPFLVDRRIVSEQPKTVFNIPCSNVGLLR